MILLRQWYKLDMTFRKPFLCVSAIYQQTRKVYSQKMVDHLSQCNQSNSIVPTNVSCWSGPLILFQTLNVYSVSWNPNFLKHQRCCHLGTTVALPFSSKCPSQQILWNRLKSVLDFVTCGFMNSTTHLNKYLNIYIYILDRCF